MTRIARSSIAPTDCLFGPVADEQHDDAERTIDARALMRRSAVLYAACELFDYCELAYASQLKNLLLRNVSPVARLQTGHSVDKASAAGEIAHSPFPFSAKNFASALPIFPL